MSALGVRAELVVDSSVGGLAPGHGAGVTVTTPLSLADVRTSVPRDAELVR